MGITVIPRTQSCDCPVEMARHGATFEDVAAALGNTVAVVAKFYSHEWN